MVARAPNTPIQLFYRRPINDCFHFFYLHFGDYVNKQWRKIQMKWSVWLSAGSL